jgi:hypothetical protein
VYELVDTCGVYEHVDVIYMCYLLLHVDIVIYIYIYVCVYVCMYVCQCGKQKKNEASLPREAVSKRPFAKCF